MRVLSVTHVRAAEPSGKIRGTVHVGEQNLHADVVADRQANPGPFFTRDLDGLERCSTIHVYPICDYSNVDVNVHSYESDYTGETRHCVVVAGRFPNELDYGTADEAAAAAIRFVENLRGVHGRGWQDYAISRVKDLEAGRNVSGSSAHRVLEVLEWRAR